MKFKKDDIVKLNNYKAIVINSFEHKRNPKVFWYEVRYIVGKNKIGDTYSVPEERLKPYKR